MKYSLILLSISGLLAVIPKTGALISTFITPTALSDIENSFTYRDLEYITVNKLLNYDLAEVYCNKVLGGHLATFSNENALKFMTEALTEVHMINDNIWVNANKNRDKWKGYINDKEQFQQVNMQMSNNHMTKKMVNNSFESPLTCLALLRQGFDEPLLVDLECSLLRPFICLRTRVLKNTITSHPGWIKIGKRQYKIFNDPVSHSDANFQCAQHDKSAKLAVVTSLEEAKILARYLLIGRPSLEYAWIGLKYIKPAGWQFPEENLILPQLTVNPETNTRNVYPPWRTNNPKNAGCGLLDRHLSKLVLFVETNCDHPKPYICYKTLKCENEDEYISFSANSGTHYRLYFKSLSWYDAGKYCQSNNNGILAEPLHEQDIKHYLHMMGNFKVSVQHIWTGGFYSDNKWFYPSSQKPFESILSSSYWINNNTYEDNVEQINLCLNIDREEHGKALIYGTQCNYPQYFICQYFTPNNSSFETTTEWIDQVNVTNKPSISSRKSTEQTIKNVTTTTESYESFNHSNDSNNNKVEINPLDFLYEIENLLSRKIISSHSSKNSSNLETLNKSNDKNVFEKEEPLKSIDNINSSIVEKLDTETSSLVFEINDSTESSEDSNSFANDFSSSQEFFESYEMDTITHELDTKIDEGIFYRNLDTEKLLNSSDTLTDKKEFESKKSEIEQVLKNFTEINSHNDFSDFSLESTTPFNIEEKITNSEILPRLKDIEINGENLKSIITQETGQIPTSNNIDILPYTKEQNIAANWIQKTEITTDNRVEAFGIIGKSYEGNKTEISDP